MCEPTTIALVASAAAGGLSAYSTYQQASAQKSIAEANAQTAERAAADAIVRGDKEAMMIRRQGSQMAGAQRNALAARGLDLNGGTATELVDQTDFFSQVDQTTARNNARREADGFRAQGANFRNEANAISPGLQTAGSLLSSASSVASSWYSMNPAAAPSSGDASGMKFSRTGADVRARR